MLCIACLLKGNKMSMEQNNRFFKREWFENHRNADEVRFICVDYGFANQIEGDSLYIYCVSATRYNQRSRFSKFSSIKTTKATNIDDVVNCVKSAYNEYKADYIVMDLRNGGEIVFNGLMDEGFGLVKNKELLDLRSAKTEDLEKRVRTNTPNRCLIPICATASFNSLAWLELRQSLKNNRWKFPIDEDTEELIKEAVSLEWVSSNCEIKLVEPRNGSKVRIQLLAYANHVLNKLID